MLRKRSRSVQKDRCEGHLMPDSVSESYFQSHVLGQKYKNSSVFSVPHLFVGFSTKGVNESDSAWSPTSPLDYRVFPNLGNPFRFLRSCPDRPQKSWDCGKVGLGLVDSLNDDNKLRLSESKNILFGSQRKIHIPSSQGKFYNSNNTCESPKSLPKNFAITLQTKRNSPVLPLGESDIASRAGKFQLETKQFGKIVSSSLDSGQLESPPTGLTYCNPSLSFKHFHSDKKTASLPPLMGGNHNLDNFLGMQPNSLPISFGFDHGLMGSLSGSEIELSEDYTCVISHGPNPRTTHIFCDSILECHTNELANCAKKEEQGNRSPQVMKSSDGSPSYNLDDFFNMCYICKKKLEEDKNIHMYRGEKVFCSCRSQEILVEEELERPVNNSSNSSPRPTYCEEVFPMVIGT